MDRRRRPGRVAYAAPAGIAIPGPADRRISRPPNRVDHADRRARARAAHRDARPSEPISDGRRLLPRTDRGRPGDPGEHPDPWRGKGDVRTARTAPRADGPAIGDG